MPPAAASETSETQLRRAAALESALRPIAPHLADPRVVEIMLNADGRIWVDRLGEGMHRADVRMGPAAAERMLRLVASENELRPASRPQGFGAARASASTPSQWR